ncbi:diguanylate cyclase [Paracoccus nototheniae]|uniref:diguanylate cyclase n=1 Tax=Paracoccus nototheniae TaxID=2489002 RepID=A0ABW4DX63_9RHOB|nr:diguanylate cyclase [Paracoccus nototheniae]
MTAEIMVADGTATARITLKVRLRAVCYQVTAVATVGQLLQQLRVSRPDLIILGSNLADGTALDLCRRLSNDRQVADIPILMLVDPDQRLAALQAGATATLDPGVDEQMLMARIRTILREIDMPPPGMQDAEPIGMAEAQAGFGHAVHPLVALVADHPARAQRWRQMLSGRMSCRFDIQTPDQALGAATSGRSADIYLIAADIRARGDGLSLLSELRTRQGSRDAGFVIAIAPERAELAAIALDLGAGDVMPLMLGTAQAAQAAAMTLQMLLSRKSRIEQRRADVQRQMQWAMTDPLTGLYNRRYALPRLTQMTREARAGSRRLAVLAIDLDHFKEVNDTYGHSAGDAVLVEIAHRLRNTIGQSGLAARMGGEEFLGVMPDCPVDQAQRLAESLRRVVQDMPVLLPGLSGGGQIRVTASVGLAMVIPSGQVGSEQAGQMAIERADRALLAAKAAGRNRVVCACADRAA